MAKCVKAKVKCAAIEEVIQSNCIPLSWKIKAYKLSDRTTLILRSLVYKDIVLGVYCGLGLDAGVCGGTEGEGGGRGMVVLATSCCYLEHNVL